MASKHERANRERLTESWESGKLKHSVTPQEVADHLDCSLSCANRMLRQMSVDGAIDYSVQKTGGFDRYIYHFRPEYSFTELLRAWPVSLPPNLCGSVIVHTCV